MDIFDVSKLTEGQLVILREMINKFLEENNDRATGRTTRLVDSYIQELFNNKGSYIDIKDHYNSREADRILVNKIEKRLQSEHRVIYTIKEKDRSFIMKIG